MDVGRVMRAARHRGAQPAVPGLAYLTTVEQPVLGPDRTSGAQRWV
jgi:hypothetical protein